MHIYMKLTYLIFCFLATLSLTSVAADRFKAKDDSLNELPQIFYKSEDTLIRWIASGVRMELSRKNTPDFAARVNQLEEQYGIPLSAALSYPQDQPSSTKVERHQDVSRWLALSDIHGQYELFVELLQNHGVINEHLNWEFGNSHLIINGDILDRGEGVTEALWLVFKLQQQADAAGGRVHYNMGNHELMVLDEDLRYIHEKYAAAAAVLGESYSAQFSEDAFFGKWIRRQSILFQINETGFVHAGISPEMADRGLRPSEINRLFTDSIFSQPKDDYRKSDLLSFLTTTNGPVWYRGYFNDESLSSSDIDVILHWWGVQHIVVGHTSQRQIRSLFDGRIFAIDSSIKNGRTGEVLIFENGAFYRGLRDGQRVSF